MPVAKCTQCGQQNRKRSPYGLLVEPAGYPHSALVCGVPGCHHPAMIWLTAWEAAEYGNGRRIFNLSGRSPKVRLGETAHKVAKEPSDRGPVAIGDGSALLGR
jgi:hypothetical protein